VTPAWPTGKYGVVLADPPWQFNSLWGGRPKKTDAGYASRAVDAHYTTLTIDEIAALPVPDLAADGPYVELFARTRREGWTCWGNEVGKFDAAGAAA
jgi:N6-adenosine-specific RNA methylase IME4